MYVGSTGERGVRQMVFEGAGRAVNEVLAGRAPRVDGPGAQRTGQGRTAVGSVKVDRPEFHGSTRGELRGAAGRACAGAAVREGARHLAGKTPRAGDANLRRTVRRAG
ncbi:hypothetical protein [Streptomyces sp. enrichment culture]|uniref:hypothetical protein n=1 Tax=Streptomyces sp. enrichment culture TaxID=1795815 RepID=UPI003F57746F